MIGRSLLTTVGATVLAGAIVTGIVGFFEYADLPGFMDKMPGAGRAKNSVAVLVAGIAAHEMYVDPATIDLDVQKHVWMDAELTGTTTPETIESNVDLALTSAKFTARKNEQGMLEGKVAKSEYNWRVKQTGPSTYGIGRFFTKWDTKLDLVVKDGTITGTYHRPPFRFNWDIEGTYDKDGTVKIEIDAPLTLGMTLEGTIAPGQ